VLNYDTKVSWYKIMSSKTRATKKVSYPSKKQIMKNENLISLIDNFPGGMVESDLNGNLLVVNATLARIFNTTREKILGKSGFSYLEKAVSKHREEFMKLVIMDKKTVEFVDYERGLWWKTIIVPKFDSSKNVIGFYAYFSNITEEMKNLH